MFSFFFFPAEKILPVVKNQHLLLVTLLVCNAAAMEVMLKRRLLLCCVIIGLGSNDFFFISDASYFSWCSCHGMGCHFDLSYIDSSLWWGKISLSCYNNQSENRLWAFFSHVYVSESWDVNIDCWLYCNCRLYLSQFVHVMVWPLVQQWLRSSVS